MSAINTDSIKNVSLSLYRFGGYGDYGSDNKYDMASKYSLHKATTEWTEDWDADEAMWEWGKDDNVKIGIEISSIDYEPKDIGWFSYDVTESIKEMIKMKSTNNGFVLKCTVNGTLQMSGNQSGFYSSEYNDVELRPKLTIVYNDAPVANVCDKKNLDKKINVYVKNKKTLFFNLPFDGEYTLRLLTLNGMEIINKTISSSGGANKIDLSNERTLSASVYVVEVKGMGIVNRESLVIK